MPLPPSIRRIFDEARLQALADYRILDTPPEPAFDAIVREAADICGTPAAFITFLNSHRQWIKASVGSDVKETTLEMAICAAAIEANQDLFIVPDCEADPRVNWSPAVWSTPPVAFYAGATLRATHGTPIGSLCVVDSQPRQGGLSTAQSEELLRLSKKTMRLLDERLRGETSPG